MEGENPPTTEEKEIEESEFEEDSISSTIINAPRGFASGIGSRFRALGSWIVSLGRGFKNFFSNPGEKLRGGYRKFRQEMDPLSTVQLLVVLAAFFVFLVLLNPSRLSAS